MAEEEEQQSANIIEDEEQQNNMAEEEEEQQGTNITEEEDEESSNINEEEEEQEIANITEEEEEQECSNITEEEEEQGSANIIEEEEQQRSNITEEEGQQVELRFRILDGTDIGHGSYPLSITIAAIKETLLSEWPQDKSVVPKSVLEMRIIHGGQLVEDGKTIAECRVDADAGEVITMHVVLQPADAVRRRTTAAANERSDCGCCCRVL